MNAKEIFVWISCLLAIVLYIPLIAGILRNKIQQSLATWALWVSLDVIALVSIIFQKGNFLLIGVSVSCGTMVILSLVYKKQLRWTWFETFVLSLVIVCLLIWSLSGPKWATIASTIAVCISGCPQFKDSWMSPDKMTGFIYLGYVLANGLSFLGGKAWTIEERFYPGMCTILCAVIMIASFRTQPKK